MANRPKIEQPFMVKWKKNVSKIRPEVFVFFATFLLYVLLWVINPGNKVIAASFLGLIMLLYFRLKDFRLSLLLAYISSLFIYTGKTYTMELIPPGFYPENLYPYGYVIPYTISPKHILAIFMVAVLARDIVNKRVDLVKINYIDLSFILFSAWRVTSDLIASARPEVSLLYSGLYLHDVIFYYYLRTYLVKKKDFMVVLVFTLLSAVFFESFASLQQFINGSPLYKNIEAQVNIELFGLSIDEFAFRFRPLGTFKHANYLGMWLSFALSVLIAFIYKRQNVLVVAGIIVGLFTLSTTLSRSSWLGMFCSLLLMLFVLEKIKGIRPPDIFGKYSVAMILVSILSLIVFVFPRVEKTLYTLHKEGTGYFRSQQVKESLSVIIQNPLFGVGTNMSVVEGVSLNPTGAFASAPLPVHNFYLLYAAEHGIPALILFLVFVLIFIRKLLNVVLKIKMTTIEDYVATGLLGGILSLLVVGLFQPFIGELMILLAIGSLQNIYLKKYERN